MHIYHVFSFALLAASANAAGLSSPHTVDVPSSNRQGSIPPTVLVHGGAGDVDDVEGKYNGTREAVRAAYGVLTAQGGSVLDAVVAAIEVRHSQQIRLSCK